MKKSISPKLHCMINYGLVGALLTVPSLFDFSKKVKTSYTAEALALLGYVALTDSTVAVKPLIPFTIHGKIDPLNKRAR